MEEIISAAEANRGFSKLLRAVRGGRSYVVTSHGRPVARIVPAERGPVSEKVRAAFLSRLKSQPVSDIGPWSRAELYEDER